MLVHPRGSGKSLAYAIEQALSYFSSLRVLGAENGPRKSGCRLLGASQFVDGRAKQEDRHRQNHEKKLQCQDALFNIRAAEHGRTTQHARDGSYGHDKNGRARAFRPKTHSGPNDERQG